MKKLFMIIALLAMVACSKDEPCTGNSATIKADYEKAVEKLRNKYPNQGYDFFVEYDELDAQLKKDLEKACI